MITNLQTFSTDSIVTIFSDQNFFHSTKEPFTRTVCIPASPYDHKLLSVMQKYAFYLYCRQKVKR